MIGLFLVGVAEAAVIEHVLKDAVEEIFAFFYEAAVCLTIDSEGRDREQDLRGALGVFSAERSVAAV